jgi:hypothetical protein
MTMTARSIALKLEKCLEGRQYSADSLRAKKGDQTPSRAKKNTATTVVMRENGKCFVTQDVAVVDDLDGIQSLVYLEDQESIGSFNKTYGDSFLRSSAIGQMAFNELADEIVNQIVNRRGAQA